MSEALPRLLDRRQIAAELNINLSSAERLMRHVPKLKIGRRVFVREADIHEFIRTEIRS